MENVIFSNKCKAKRLRDFLKNNSSINTLLEILRDDFAHFLNSADDVYFYRKTVINLTMSWWNL